MSQNKLIKIESQDAQVESDLGASIKSYLLSGQFSDLTIRTIDQEFKVHRLVVCGQSEYFSRLYKGEWTETNTNDIPLHDDDPGAIQAMIHFMYGFDYDSSGSEHSRASPMLFTVKVYQVADKYAVPQLKQKAKEKFETIVQTCWQMDDFPVAIAEAYKCTLKTDQGLREPLVRISMEHMDTLLKNEAFVDVLENTTGFASELATILAKKKVANPKAKGYRCPGCSSKWMVDTSAGQNVTYCIGCGDSRQWSSYVVRD
ncbi:hypothetical protein PISL3812_07896 [Talaromyces islandicus]|uniref:BTB domain-containing protein n=1 Tax=Talaromyces islandicus TaxID=28573 RepID=A0A0U1M7A5_TALIS|nr:hypothetical protein PISL3812_07896 [Talaromyces islandicus]